MPAVSEALPSVTCSHCARPAERKTRQTTTQLYQDNTGSDRCDSLNNDRALIILSSVYKINCIHLASEPKISANVNQHALLLAHGPQSIFPLNTRGLEHVNPKFLQTNEPI